ncbi:M1 family metallopeptidase [Sphingomonas mollis]|uniref:Aminopeptidase n=1 Tax=Sphingomonas mollis TaxID=2795726 RepID=A0ABS0XP20_9SPHN|nr:M1 family metallopeptidase [Sphingomonas sp. BT553]MBJ6121774.1 M1 family metallopeptidase [Sphingomonas sp. BT553]
MKFAAPLFLAVTVSGPALAAGQLPRTVVPVLYEIDIQPDATSLIFAGTETVTVDVRQATRTMTLNAADLNVTAATFDGKPARISTDAAAQTLTVTLPAAATVGQHRLAFKWTGKINQSAAGLFAIDYTNVDGSKARMLATQFEAPDARRFAPMWDEPSFKAKFRLSSTAPAGETAYSNMPATSVTKRADGSQLYRFGETPVMSSYLLFLGMGDIERRTVTANGTEIGVIARRGVIDQGDYALGAAKRLLSYYNDYFGQPYPLPKMDMIAGPGSSQFFSAMENWGAIFYFEPTLLFDPSRTAASGRQSVHVTVAHEMAHQWFGDLVTMAWWDDLWLNEGFASWMEGKATADLNPGWKAGASAVAFERESAMAIDATSATHPIVRKVETVDQIGEAFDGITYMKGQAVIGMMESTLGADVFRDGIRRYMAKYKYGNTVTNQLWTELSAASGRDIGGIARDFTLQGGVPLVTMTGTQCVGGDTKVSLGQGRFGLDMPSKQPQTWRVPLVVSTIGGGSANAVVTGAKPTSLTVKGCGTVVLNAGKGSYTRAMYDDAGHAAVVRDYGRLSLEDRLGTLGDDFALALGGYQPLDRYFAVQAQVGAGADPLEWSMVAAKLERLAELLAGTPLEQRLRERTRTLLTPVLGRIGFEAKNGESPLVGNLRERLIEQLGSEGDANVMARARDYVSRMRNDPAALPGAIRQPILSTYAVNATPAEWDILLAMTKAERSPVTKNGYVRLLGASADESNAQRALALLKTDVLTDPQKASLLRAIAGAHADLAYDWAVANQATVDGFIEQSSRTGFIVGLASGSKDPAMPAKVASYAKKYLPAGSRGPADRVIAQMKINREAGDRLQAGTARWLGQ